MFVVAKATSVGGEGVGEGIFAGMSERRMTEVVAEGYCLGEVFVQAKGAGYGAGYLHHLQGMGKAGPVVIAVWGDKDLGLVHEAAEGFGVDDAVPVALELVADTVGGLEPNAADAKLASPVRGSHAGRRAPGRALPGA